jgi:GT2 family glycosyltransferase
MISLGVLVTTIGRPSLKNLLNSITPQLLDDDKIYLCVDGVEYFDLVENILKDFDTSKIILIKNEENLGYWGHGLRNKYQSTLTTTHIMHADDDDVYIPNSFDGIRESILEYGNNKLLIFKFFTDRNERAFVWRFKEIRFGNIGTPSGVLPNNPEKMGVWGYRYGGDADFYKSCEFEYEFIDKLIYKVNK